MKPHPARLDPSIYPHRVEIKTRFADIDPQRHLNNARIVELYQEARISFNVEVWERSDLESASRRILVARQSVDYLGEVEWPGTVSIGVGVARTGNTSYTIGMAMFYRGKCAGVSDTVLVYASETGPAPLPQRLRDALAARSLPLV